MCLSYSRRPTLPLSVSLHLQSFRLCSRHQSRHHQVDDGVPTSLWALLCAHFRPLSPAHLLFHHLIFFFQISSAAHSTKEAVTGPKHRSGDEHFNEALRKFEESRKRLERMEKDMKSFLAGADTMLVAMNKVAEDTLTMAPQTGPLRTLAQAHMDMVKRMQARCFIRIALTWTGLILLERQEAVSRGRHQREVHSPPRNVHGAVPRAPGTNLLTLTHHRLIHLHFLKPWPSFNAVSQMLTPR